ncbi:YaeQ family protein [Verrucomicrobiota bacterium sgz303538]
MALKATIYKAQVQLADMDRSIYSDHAFTIARHPSETDERMMVRLLAFALNVPGSDEHGILEFAKDMWDADEPAIWEKDLTGRVLHWIEVGQPDEKRFMQTSSRCDRVSVYSFASSTDQWWSSIASKITRARNVSVWQVPATQSALLSGLANRTMKLDVTVQEGTIWVGDGVKSVEIAIRPLLNPPKQC